MTQSTTWIYGGDMTVADYRFQRFDDDSQTLYVADTAAGRETFSIFAAVSTLLHFGLMRDHVRFGSYFKDGIINSILFFLFLFFHQIFSLHLYLKCLVFDNSFSFAGLWSLAFGRKTTWIGALIVLLSIIDIGFGATGAFSSLIQQIVIVNWPDSPALFRDNWFLALGLPLIVVIPVLFISDFRTLRVVSYLGNAFLLVTVISVIIDAVEQRDTLSVGPDLEWWTGHVVETLGVFAINCGGPITLVLPETLRVLDRPSRARVRQLIWLAFAVMSSIVIVCGVLTYLTYFRWIGQSGLLSYNFMNPRSGATIALELGIAVNILLTAAAFVWWQAKQLTVFFVPNNSAWLADFVSGVTILLFTILTSFAPGSVVTLLNFIALVPRTLLLYVVPSLFFLKFFKFRRLLWSLAAVVALVIGVVITLAAYYWGLAGCVEAFNA
jgi:hypothetical protein